MPMYNTNPAIFQLTAYIKGIQRSVSYGVFNRDLVQSTNLNSPILITLLSGNVICKESLSASSQLPATTCTFAD